MKNFFKNFRSYSFLASLTGAIIILINALGRAFGFSIENQNVGDCLMSIAGVLVVLGIVTKRDGKKENKQNDQENKSDEGEK